jgi:homocysteine S-methyltransferase
MALAATAKPYVLSFVVRPEGTLLDGTPLKSAIATIDAAVTPGPLAYLINCTHVSFAASALMHETNSSTLVRYRIIGLLANTAALSPEELNDNSSLVEEDPEIFGQSVAALHRELGLKILGDAAVPTTVTSGPWQPSLQFRHKRILQMQKTSRT